MDVDPKEGSAPLESSAEYGVAAAYEAFKPDECDHPHCSGSSDFCFLCEFQDNGGEEDLYRDIMTLIRNLLLQKREPSAIVSHVYRTYNECVRSHVSWRRSNTEIVEAPLWSRESIHRHLTFSTEFREAFSDTLERVFHSMLVKINNHLVDEEGRIVEQQRKAFIETVKAYDAHRKAVAAVGNIR